jgi:glycosyltransferase involved in cell wall biosynthesis
MASFAAPAQASGRPMNRTSSGIIIFQRERGRIDAIDQYCNHLTSALIAQGVAARYIADGPDAVQVTATPPDWILVQYNPFSYGRAGIAPRFLNAIRRLRRRWRVPLAVMVHEAWIDIADAKSAAIGAWQRGQLRLLLESADAVMVSNGRLAEVLGGGALHTPIASTIIPTDLSRPEARASLALPDRLTVALAGRNHPDRLLDYAERAIAAIARTRGVAALTVLNIGSDAPPIRVPDGIEVRTAGTVEPDQLSQYLHASDLALLPVRRGLSTKRTTMMAALAHGVAVLGLRGYETESLLSDSTDALTLTPIGDRGAYEEAAAELAGDSDRLAELGSVGRRMYESRFDWPVLASKVASVLDLLSARRSRGLTFVAHHIGGPGGMERHTEQLLGRLVDGGRPVTVIARKCQLEPRPGLRIRRVPAPRRPFVLLYPTFFALGSLIAARHREPLLHTTGALIGNRADISTVHYCHRAALSRIEGSRAGGSGLLHKLNQTFGGPMSRFGERWCYRPGRTALLCAVSDGVRRELESEFPAMADLVDVIPNGVDTSVFRPDEVVRTTKREELGIGPASLLALFVGGDWERKGLPEAIAALEHAPEWTLVVAGDGDRGRMRDLAHAANADARLLLLGPVEDMPALYAAADAFVFPTSYEAFPLVVLEAAASGVPLLVTQVNGAEEVIEDGINGWFVTRDAADIARRLTQLARDRGRARAMGIAATVAAQPYTWEAMSDRYQRIYERLRPSVQLLNQHDECDDHQR